MSSGDIERILPFPTTSTEFSAKEKAHRVRAEAERLSRLAEVDWKFQLKARAELFGVEEPILRAMVIALLKAREKRTREEKAEEQRREKQRLADQKREERERQREHNRADQEAQRKRRKKEMEFSKLNKLPHSEQDVRLAKLAQRLGEDFGIAAR